MAPIMTGGCLCGRIRYSAEIDGSDAGMCHCRMCRRSSGGFAAAMVQVSPSAVSWDQEPERFRSSPIAERMFCGHCGSPLGWALLDGTAMDLSLGSFDDPSRFVPVAHGGAESMLEAWLDTSALPRYETREIEAVVQQYKAQGLEVPE